MSEGKLEIPGVQSITVLGKTYNISGNTYHSVTVLVNGIEIGYIPFEYGYGEQYRWTALTILQKHGYFNTGRKFENGYPEDQHNWSKYQRDNYDTCRLYVVPVKRKKDL